jgi:hypothetical protein
MRIAKIAEAFVIFVMGYLQLTLRLPHEFERAGGDSAQQVGEVQEFGSGRIPQPTEEQALNPRRNWMMAA